jgi:hypothetical protein
MVDDHFRHDAPLARKAGEEMGVRPELCQLSVISAKLSGGVIRRQKSRLRQHRGRLSYACVI